jgi:signal transduction histidine kinase
VAELLRVVKHRLSATLGVRLYSLFLYTPETRALDLLSSSHVPERTRLSVNDPPRTLMDEVIANRQPLVIEDFARSPFASASPHEPMAPYFSPTCVAVPLFFRGQLVGVLTANDKQGCATSFAEEDVRWITLVGEHLASVLQNHQTLEQHRDNVKKLQCSLEVIQQTQDLLIRMEKRAAVAYLLAGLAHEIRNPLNSMSLFVENILDILGRECAPKAVGACAGYLAGLHDEIGRLQRLLNAFLDFARIPNQEPTPTDAESVLRKALALLEPELKTAGIALHEEYQKDLPQVLGGEEELSRCALNIFLNAVEAMPKGGTLSIRLARDEDRMALTVADTGEGIPPEHLGKIFNPFFTTRAKGIGLGLALVSRYLDAIGGEVQVTSDAGRGTTVRLSLPLAQEEPQEVLRADLGG